ncbi:autotransporter outer membrane beta-barrel domain-containing protein [Gymnodinialimonas ulvae]|uniref:autotransporter outer membrane beta-barrel domain-containing protein n=1 Tax=Gymnodinialimonas ulvae TaxID=3126504 RepID=UPI0030EB4280
MTGDADFSVAPSRPSDLDPLNATTATAARNTRIEIARVADGTAAGDVTVSTSGVPGMMDNLYTWAEVTWFRSTEFGPGDGTLSGGGIQIGADIEIGADMVAGLSLGHSRIESENAGTSVAGDYTYLQPYFASRSGAWSGTASLIYGAGSFDVDDGAGEADVRLAALTFEGGYDYALAPGFTLTPTLGLIYGREEVEGTAGTLAGCDSEVSFSQLSLGGRLTHLGPDGGLFAGLHADYLTNDTESLLTQDLLAEDGWSARVEVGGQTALGSGLNLDISVELSGLGGDMRTVSGGLRIALRF